MGIAVSIKGYSVDQVMDLYRKMKEAGAGDWHGENNFRTSLSVKEGVPQYMGFNIPYLAVDESGDIVGYTFLNREMEQAETEEELIKMIKERK